MSVDEPPRASPYQGLAPFTEHDRSWFFGREAQVSAMLRQLEDRSFVAVAADQVEDHVGEVGEFC